MQLAISSLVLTATLLVGRPAIAQTTTTPDRAIVTIYHVKPDHWNEFLDLQAQFTEVTKKTSAKVRVVWTSGVLGDRHLAIVVSQLGKFADFDSPSPARAAMGEGPYQRWVSRLMTCIHSSVRTIETERNDLSLVSPMEGTPKLAVIQTVHVLPGKAMEYEALVKGTLLPAWKKGEARNVWAYRQSIGGNPGTYTFVWPLDKYAELDQPNAARRGLGEAGYAAYVAKLAGLIAGSDTQLVKYEDKLSFQRQ